MNKKALRSLYLEKRSQLTPKLYKEWNSRLVDLFFREFKIQPNSWVHIFMSITEKNEIDTQPFIRHIRKIPARIAVPRINMEKTQLEHLELSANTQLSTNKWGIQEPVGDQLIPEQYIDWVLIPLLAIDQRGHRVGYGKGYYDRFLVNCRPDVKKVGLSFYSPETEEITDVNPYDIKLDYCVTPNQVFQFV